MCFNTTTEDFGATRSGGIPIPGTKPSVVDGGGSVLGSIWNSAKGVFEGIASIELQKYEAERLADVRAAEQEGRIAYEQQLAGIGLSDLTPQQQVIGGSSLAAIVLLGAAFVLISRRS